VIGNALLRLLKLEGCNTAAVSSPLRTSNPATHVRKSSCLERNLLHLTLQRQCMQ